MMSPPEAGTSTSSGEMSTREMNAASRPGETPVPSATEVAGTSDMPIREMNSEPQQPGGGRVETAHEREKLLAYLRDRQRSQAAGGSVGAGEMPARNMNSSG